MNKNKEQNKGKSKNQDNIGQVETLEIRQAIETAYLDYAMSVIMSRAIPDARDGLKPVHRRILVTLNNLKLYPKSRFRKAAKICGDVSGNYHPHGEVIVFPSLALLAQDFKMRYPLVKGQGNWGSIDGDSPAAMRYVEAKMEKIALEILADLDKDTVDWRPNYDSSRTEPVVLPTRVPQLLLNGTMGIAVGMATNIPPHNLAELIDALIYLLKHPQATIKDLMQFIQGPDFPTGGIIYSQKDIQDAYQTGQGGVVVRGRARIESPRGKKTGRIVISEIPFQVNKSTLVEKIADLVRDKKLEGVRDVRDESDREGMRVVIELKADAFAEKILNRIYSLTELQKRFNFNMLALSGGIQPQVMSLKELLTEFLKHRQQVVQRRSRYELKLAQARLHILEGLDKALDDIDLVIETIRKSKTKSQASKNLIKKFSFTKIQAEAILEMRLSALAGLEQLKIRDELKQKQALIAELKALLASKGKISQKIIDELAEIKTKYQDPRRTKVVKRAVSRFREEDLIPDEDTVITLTHGGYIKRVNPKIYRVQHRGGKGIIGMTTRGDDVITHFRSARTHDRILFFTSLGRVFEIQAYEIPDSSRVARGQALVNFLGMEPGETVTAMLVDKGETEFLLMATTKGIVKKTKASDFKNVRRSGLKAITLGKNDELKWVKLAGQKDEVMLVTEQGQSIHFKSNDARAMGRSARGVKGIKLKASDQVVFMDIIKGDELLVLSNNGYGKKTPISQYKVQKRGGTGIKTLSINQKVGQLSTGLVLDSKQAVELVATSASGQVIRIKSSSVSTMGRATQGVRVMRLEQGDSVVSITQV